MAFGWVLALLTFASFGSLAAAQSASQSYLTNDTNLKRGMAVALTAEQPSGNQAESFVQPSSTDRAKQTLGVVVNLDDSLVVASNNSTQRQVYVASSGTASVYVTDVNGLIKKGDLLVASPLEGVLMRSDGSNTLGVLGVALEDFPVDASHKVDLQGGPISTARVATIAINMDVKLAGSADANQNWLEKIAQKIVKRPVNPVQALVALAMLVLLIVVEGGIVYATTSSTILSLGRNPLAKRSILGGLAQSLLLVVFVMVTGLLAIYLVLRV